MKTPFQDRSAIKEIYFRSQTFGYKVHVFGYRF